MSRDDDHEPDDTAADDEPAEEEEAAAVEPPAEDEAPAEEPAAEDEALSEEPAVDAEEDVNAPSAVGRAVRELLPPMTSMKLLWSDDAPSRFTCAVRWKKAVDGAPEAVADRIVDQFAARGITMIPMFYAEEDWPAVEMVGPARWNDPRSADHLREHVRGGEPLRSKRRFLVELQRSHRALLEHLSANAEGLPGHNVLEIAEGVAREELALLFASQGLSFAGDASDIATFEEHFLADGHFRREDIRTWLRLSARSTQAKHFFGLGGRELRGPSTVTSYVRLLLDLNRRFGDYIGDVEPSDEERAARTRRLKQVWLGSGVLAWIVFIAWLVAPGPMVAIDDESVITAPGGIQAEYFKGKNFDKSVRVRTDPRISIRGLGAPAPGVPRDRFSVRWTGYLHFPESGPHQLCTLNDDGARLFLNEVAVVDDWKPHSAKRTCGEVDVAEGWHSLRVEFFDKHKTATMKVLVGQEDTSVTEVPPERLCCKQP